MKRIATAILALVLLSVPAYSASATRSPGGGPPGAPPFEHPGVSAPAHAADDVPDYGAADKVVAAYKAHTINDDELVRYGTQWLIGDPALPERFRAAEDLGERSPSYQAFLATKASKASPQTRAWLDTVFAGDRAGTVKAISGVAPTVAADTPTGPVTLPDDPNNECGLDVKFLLEPYECRYRNGNIRIYYNIARESPPAARTIPAVFTRSSDTPDGILQMVQGADAAFATYRQKLGMRIDVPDAPLPIYIGAFPVEKKGSALAWPFDNLGEGVGAPVIMMPSKFGTDLKTPKTPKTQYNYLTRHEIFHAFQYHYIANAKVVWELAATNWWMEATAEWATHKSYEDDPGYYGEPGENTYYARNADKFFGRPDRPVNAFDGFGSSRQYSVNPFAQYLTERTTPDFVRLTWENYAATGSGTAMSAIVKTLADRRLDPAALMLDFAIANYRLAAPVPIYTSADGWTQVPGYHDPHAATAWRSVLQETKNYPTRSDFYGPARPAHQSWELGWSGEHNTTTGAQSADVYSGGAFYADIVPQAVRSTPDDRGIVKVHVDLDPRLRYKLLSWRRTPEPNTATPTVDEMIGFDAKGDATARVLSPETAFTLVVVRSDLIFEPLDAAASVSTVHWNAALTPDVNTHLTVEGDPGTAAALYAAQHSWFAFDTEPGKRFYIAGSVPEYATVYLRNSTGGVIATDYAESSAKRHMFGGAEWTASGKGPCYVEVVPRDGSTTTAATVRVLSDVPVLQAVPDGDPVTPTTTKWGQHLQVTFPATAGRYLYFAADTPGVTYAKMYDPNGKSVSSDTSTTGGRRMAFAPMTASVTGTYKVALQLPAGQLASSAFRVLSDVPTVAGQPDGSTVAVTGTKWGQLTRVTFQAGANQVFYASGKGDLWRLWTLKGPRGQVIESHNEQDRKWTNMFGPRVLTEAGTYTLEITSQFGDTQTSSVRMFDTAEAADTSIGGPAVTLSVSPGGKQALIRFDGTAGRKVDINGNAPYGTYYELRDATTGKSIASGTVLTQTGPVSFFQSHTLPSTGRYQLWLAPPADRTTPAPVSVTVSPSG